MLTLTFGFYPHRTIAMLIAQKIFWAATSFHKPRVNAVEQERVKRRVSVIFSNIYDRTIFNWVVIECSTQEWFFWLIPVIILIGVNENGFFCCIFRNSGHFLKLLCTITDQKFQQISYLDNWLNNPRMQFHFRLKLIGY